MALAFENPPFQTSVIAFPEEQQEGVQTLRPEWVYTGYTFCIGR